MDEYLVKNSSYERLYEEYKKYGKLVIGFDFDNTVYDYHKTGKSYEMVRQLLRELVSIGCKTILSLLKIGVICGSYCSTVNKYVFYTPSVSPHNSFGHTLEFTNELTFNNLKKYIENEHITK